MTKTEWQNVLRNTPQDELATTCTVYADWLEENSAPVMERLVVKLEAEFYSWLSETGLAPFEAWVTHLDGEYDDFFYALADARKALGAESDDEMREAVEAGQLLRMYGWCAAMYESELPWLDVPSTATARVPEHVWPHMPEDYHRDTALDCWLLFWGDRSAAVQALKQAYVKAAVLSAFGDDPILEEDVGDD